ncbi:hypothetical protein [Rhizobium lusitanum]|uniref:hypothetical protein n=1 Tax=Rhizobium lusitanum TaxID=293958 RepID=UPI00195AE41C|nr:hypothetical protein [Rhizobium lusitanum]MBM7047562.1 hypothetical protein [Rhizobium lusitanum]
MPVLKNARHEKFSQLRAEGKTQDEAYELAGFKPSRHHASRLATKGNIQARVAEIQGRAAERAAVTIHSLTDELEEARAIAIAEKQSSAAVAAVMGKAKLHGHLIDKRRLEGPNGGPVQIDLTGYSREQLESVKEFLAHFASASSGDAETGEGGDSET